MSCRHQEQLSERIVTHHILDSWHPANPHRNQHNQIPGISTTRLRQLIAYQPTPHHHAPHSQTSQEQRTSTHLLTLIWWKKKAYIFSNLLTSIYLKQILLFVVSCNHTLIYNVSRTILGDTCGNNLSGQLSSNCKNQQQIKDVIPKAFHVW